ncbi:hypothetical protein EJB05_29938 [Eragrostis curvula]|uniref:Uncharacterized protein n=1 Tax=Eragrostis curvula TaxID=38414 RepID=A0A5J9UUU9_9POAL|nr:hypothetical protein EJB05_29938 [Eragrostis curvula]
MSRSAAPPIQFLRPHDLTCGELAGIILYAKKFKELKECRRLKVVQLPEEQKDMRPLDEILCFINGNGGGSFVSGSVQSRSCIEGRARYSILKALGDWKQRQKGLVEAGHHEPREEDETKCQMEISLRELAHKSTMEDAISSQRCEVCRTANAIDLADRFLPKLESLNSLIKLYSFGEC